MKLAILDANAVGQTIVTAGQEAIVDHSTTLAAATAQQALSVNANRSGFFFQNIGAHDMWLNELGTAAVGVAGSIKVPSGGAISSFNYPVFTSALSVIGTMGDAFTCREW